MKRILFIFSIAVLLFSNTAQAQKPDDLNLSAMIQPADSSLFVRDAAYYNWCNSIVRDEQGVYHLFYSRWPKSIGFFSWLTHSEIAHAVASSPEGPYTDRKTVMTARPDNWDAVTLHNVKVKAFDNKYYMYYTTTNTGEKKLSPKMLEEVGRTGYSHKYWPLLRFNQRTGVATSTSLTGEWIRKNSPMIEPSVPIGNVTVNPAVAQGPNGKYYLIIKGDKITGNKKGLIQAIGTSANPDGPFVLEPKPAFDEIPTEDVSMWYDKKRERFYGIFHAHGGNFLGLITSEDGTHWEKAKHYEVCKKEIPLQDGTSIKADRFERPFVYIENDEPVQLCVAAKKGNDAYIVFFKLK